MASVCLVCSIPPKPKTSHHSHYGALCCMSCKAFFKRIGDEGIVSESGLKYSCKKKNPGFCNTHYQVSTKEKCKRCRYLKCIDVGMDPNQICAGEQRNKFTRNNLFCFKEGKKGSKENSGNRNDLNEMMTSIVNAYEVSVAEVQLNRDIVQFLFEGHLIGAEWTLEHSKAVLRVMEIHPRNLALMASKLTSFQSICKEDQDLLLEENLPLFYQYILGKYLMDKGGSTQLSWLLAADVADKAYGKLNFINYKSAFKKKCISIPGTYGFLNTQKRSLEDLNKWGQLISLKNYMSSGIFIKCIHALDLYFQYPPFFTGLIGYYALLTTDHWTDDQRACLKDPNLLKAMHKEAEEIILLGWNEKNSDPSVGVGQLNTLTKTLDIMRRVTQDNTFQGEDLKGAISTVCSVMENEWIKESLGMLKEAFRAHQFSPELIKLYKDMSRNKYESFDQRKDELFDVYQKRMNAFIGNYGKGIKINNGSLQTICMFIGVHNQLLPNLEEQLAWQMGLPSPPQSEDPFGVSSMPVVSLLGLLQSTGNFVCRKQEQFRFNQVVKELKVFAQSEEVSHLLMMSLAASDETLGSLQKYYQKLLVKKLSEDCQRYGAETGDHALCILRSLLKEYVGLMERFVSYTFGRASLASLELENQH